MTAISLALALELVAEASRAPSAHNTQPARWRFTADGFAWLFEDPSRRLVVGDPTGRDQMVALGAAFEGMNLALSRRGLALSEPQPASAADTGPAGLRLVARATVQRGPGADLLADQVVRRGTYRGRFAATSTEALATLRAVVDRTAEIILVVDPGTIRSLAREADRASAAAVAQRPYQTELHRWIRFDHRDPNWTRDGLTADCLGWSTLERVAARGLFRPGPFAFLARLGLHRALIAEAGRIATAAALAIVTRPRGALDLAAGRRLYRFWLEITARGFAAQPMSSLVDDPASVARVRALAGVSHAVELVNVLAVGTAAPDWRAVSARLPPQELLV